MLSGLIGSRKLPPNANRIAKGAIVGDMPDWAQNPTSTGTNKASQTPPTGHRVKTLYANSRYTSKASGNAKANIPVAETTDPIKSITPVLTIRPLMEKMDPTMTRTTHGTDS